MTLVIPSYFKAGDSSSFSDYTYNNVTLKMGQIIKANYPNPDQNTTAFISYDVMVNEQKNNEQYTVIYYDCMPAQLFGSAADYFEYTLRTNISPDDSADDLLTSGKDLSEQDDDTVKKLLGATVIIACMGGDATSPVIVGYLPNFFINKNEKYVPQSKDDGKFLRFNFNGVGISINNDGELFVIKKGPTLNDGKLDEDNSNKDQANSFFKINKDGEILLSTTNKDDPDKLSNDDLDNLVLIDKKGNITIKSDSGKVIEIKNKDSDVLFTLGGGDQHVAVAEEVQKLYDSLKQYIENAMVPTGMGPSGTILSGSGPAPSWNDSILSKTMKLPK